MFAGKLSRLSVDLLHTASGLSHFIPSSVRGIYASAITLEEHNWTSEEKEAYEKALMAEKDMRSAFRYEFNQGVAKGEKKASTEIAKNLLKAGIDFKVVSDTTGLTADELESLQKQTYSTSSATDFSGKREYHSFAFEESNNSYEIETIGATDNLYYID